MAYGVVARYNQRDGYGLIKERSGKYIHVEGRHIDRALRQGDVVEFEMIHSQGRTEARDVVKIL
jgi:cold shock CspA family protein